jgi:phosphonatase-like hydrolase
MSIKLVVLDIAGTTVKDDNTVSKAFQSALAQNNFAVNLDIINPLMGYEKKAAILKILQALNVEAIGITDKIIQSIYDDFVEQMVVHYKFDQTVEALPNVEETLLSIRKAGIKVAINTGFPKVIAHAIVNRLKWHEKGIIDFVIGSDEVILGRPYPYMIAQIMKELNISDSKTVAKVGDTEVDMREGHAAGCLYVIGITTGTFSREELAQYEPTHIIDNMSELLPILIN